MTHQEKAQKIKEYCIENGYRYDMYMQNGLMKALLDNFGKTDSESFAVLTDEFKDVVYNLRENTPIEYQDESVVNNIYELLALNKQ